MTAASPVAFSIGSTIRSALLAVRRAPARTCGAAAVLSVPLVLSALAVAAAMNGGADTALQGLLAGAPASAPGAIVVRPDSDGQRTLMILALLVLSAAAWPIIAGLLVGAASRPHPATLSELARLWPAFALTLLVQVTALGVLLAALGIAASLAGRVQFQLPAVVLVPGVLLLGSVALRLSLWPAIALRDDVGVIGATRTAWRSTRGHVLRIGGVAIGIAAAALGPALVLAVALRVLLDALAWNEVIVLSPVAIDALALAGLLPGALLMLVLWGIAARELAHRVQA